MSLSRHSFAEKLRKTNEIIFLRKTIDYTGEKVISMDLVTLRKKSITSKEKSIKIP